MRSQSSDNGRDVHANVLGERLHRVDRERVRAALEPTLPEPGHRADPQQQVSLGLSVLAVTNMYPTPDRPGWGVFVEQQVAGLRQIGVEVQVFYVDRVKLGMRSYFRMHGKLSAAAASFKPSLVHVMYGGVMADQVTRREWNVPTVVTFHGSDLLGENLNGLFRKWIARYGVYCSRRAARQSGGVVLVADRLKRALPSTVNPSKLRVIPCGIDLDTFHPIARSACQQQLGWSGQAFHILFPASAQNAVKRPWLAVASVERLRRTGGQVELHFLSGIPNREVPVWMNASDALILTSAHEGSPTVVKEALACNLPVVSVDVGDVSERIAGIDGCHLASADPDELARKLLQVRRDKRRLAARDKLQDLSIQSSAQQLLRFYSELLHRARMAFGPGRPLGCQRTS